MNQQNKPLYVLQCIRVENVYINKIMHSYFQRFLIKIKLEQMQQFLSIYIYYI